MGLKRCSHLLTCAFSEISCKNNLLAEFQRSLLWGPWDLVIGWVGLSVWEDDLSPLTQKEHSGERGALIWDKASYQSAESLSPVPHTNSGNSPRLPLLLPGKSTPKEGREERTFSQAKQSSSPGIIRSVWGKCHEERGKEEEAQKPACSNLLLGLWYFHP